MQFWDEDHLVARELGDQLPANMQPHCCRNRGVLWDVVALYSPAAWWQSSSPDFVDGSVVKASASLEKRLHETSEQAHFYPRGDH
jgi:hypothetical protein